MKLKYILLSFIFLGIIPCVYSCEKSNMKDSQKPPEQEEELKVGSDLQLEVKVFDNKDKQVVSQAVVEIFKNVEDRALGKNIIVSHKTSGDGVVVFKASEFNKNNVSLSQLNGVYYLNIYFHNLRLQAETPSLNFEKDKTIRKEVYLMDEMADVITVKVAVLYENPVYEGKHFHNGALGVNWYDPVKLSQDYEKTLEEISGYTVDYQVVTEIEADTLFTYFQDDPGKKHISIAEMVSYLREPGWNTLKARGTKYNYNESVKFYGFDKMRDNGEIHEVWVWSFPYGGMWESHMMGKDAFWINSPPNENPSCTELLSIMGLNYERDLACALESYGHRFESTMMKVYGWWDYDKKTSLFQLTTWEKYSAYGLIYNKFENGKAQVGNVHFPPNGKQDYDFGNETYILSYANEWLNYPFVRGTDAKRMNRTEWGNPEGSWHLGWMKYYFFHLPHYNGVNPVDGKLNNWWHYVVDYNAAIKKQTLE